MTNLQSCQHIDTDGTACPSKPYLSCPHCQLQICLKHVNLHQEYLQMDFMRLCDEINQTRWTLDHLTFDPSHQRDHLIKALDQWYEEEIRLTEKHYREKRKQIEILYIKSQMQFDIYKCQKEKQFCDNLQKHVKQVLHQEQIHRDDLDQLRSKLNSIRRGLEELQHLNIQIECDPSQRNINILQKPYIEAAKVNKRERKTRLMSNDLHLFIRSHCLMTMIISYGNQTMTMINLSTAPSPAQLYLFHLRLHQ